MDLPGSALLAPARLADVRRSGLLDTGPEEPFDRLTRLACDLLDAPFGFVTVVDERRSFWKSCIGVTGGARQNPAEESFCQYVIATDDAVIVDDARLDPMTWENPSIASMGVIAWAGYPVRSPDGHVLGSFCVVDSRPRAWTDRDRRILQSLAQAASGEVGLRIVADEARESANRYRQLARALRETLLPRQLPACEGLELAVTHQLDDTQVFAGFHDTVPSPTGWAVFVGDTPGSHAFTVRTSALAKHTLRAGAQRATSPAIVLNDLHTALEQWSEETGTAAEVTVTYAALRRTPEGFAVRLSTAGHPPAVIHRADGAVERAGGECGALGAADRPVLKVDDFTLGPGDRFVLALGADHVVLTIQVR